MASYRGTPPKSAWQESDKALNASVLARGTYDVLVVPFQVGGYAIDRVDRSLMTRLLVNSLEQSGQARIPSPTLVARALGDTRRTFDEYDIYQFANKIGVKQIIRGYAGHDLKERMKVTLVVQNRRDGEYFSSSTPTETISWQDLAISDVHTPSQAFGGILPEISLWLHLHEKQKDSDRKQSKNIPALPAGLKGLVVDSSSPALTRAYYFQLLAMLYPTESVYKEQLFERSLVVLRELPDASPHYNVLKARALFYLHRRPAALEALGSPKNAAERVLFAVMEGDQQSIRKNINDIKEPLPLLIAQIENSDLRWQYSAGQAGSESNDAILKLWPGAEDVLAHRLAHWDIWNVPSNLGIKMELDKLFPIPGFTAEDMIKKKLVVGELPTEEDDDVDFSVYNHYRHMMEKQPEILITNESTSVVDRDILDLMVSMSVSNLTKKIRLRSNQGLYDDMTRLVDRYSAIYGGHTEISFLKSLSLFHIANTKQGQSQKNLRDEARKIQQNVCYWSQGQTNISTQKSCFDNSFYDADYPRRWYWKLSSNPKALSDRAYLGPKDITPRGNIHVTSFDRKELINYGISLAYTQTDYSILSSYHDKLTKLNMRDEAETLLQKNSARFIGNSARTTFFAWAAEKEGDLKRAESIYEDALNLQPNSWDPYQGLSLLQIRQGEVTKASKTALKYPLFSVSGDKLENSAISTVALSNHAYKIGDNLMRVGAVEEAKPLFRLSAGYDTGSGAEMRSITYLALLDQDYQSAAQASLQNAKRYNGADEYGIYMELLHVMGYHDQAWSVLPLFQAGRNKKNDMNPVLTGLRAEGKTTEEQMQWLKNQPDGRITAQDAVAFAFLVYSLDRRPDMNISEKLKSGREQPEPIKAPTVTPPFPNVKLMTHSNAMQADFAKKHGDAVSLFAVGYVSLKGKLFSKAFETLDVRFSEEFITDEMFSFAMPYLAWSAAKSGQTTKIIPYLDNYKKARGDDFDYHLSQVFLSAGRNNHDEAIKHLESARYHVQQVNGKRLFSAWYQLAETCEWLYEDSKFDGYRKLLLRFVKIRQNTWPMSSWAYAFEAKYTDSAADRIQALGIALYLDKDSERIAHFSEHERKGALERLKGKNPFLQMKRKQPGQDV
jgi:tetratricopeptide (TPR) repeat protein